MTRTPTTVAPTAWLSPPAVARELAIRESKVSGWIHSGELTAVNVAEHSGGRPRWRIRREDLEAFLLRRQSAGPAPTVKRRRRTDPNIIKFF